MGVMGMMTVVMLSVHGEVVVHRTIEGIPCHVQKPLVLIH